MAEQLALSGLKLRDSARFNNFYLGESQSNKQIHEELKRFANPTTRQEQYIYLWGRTGAGCSHLLQACCHEVNDQGLPCMYIPLDQAENYSPELLTDLSGLALLALDNIQCVLGDKQWEQALFHCFNQLRDNNTALIIAGNKAPRHLACDLPDLASRLSWGLILQLQQLTQEEKHQALQLRAKARGLVLTDEVAQFLLRRLSRNLHDLFSTLEVLDEASLRAQHRLTIPFVKRVLCL